MRACGICKYWKAWERRIENPRFGDCFKLTGGEKRDGIVYLRVYDDSEPIGTREDFSCQLFKEE